MLKITSSPDGLTVRAPAKVNLTLRVLGTRPDGYHALESVVAGVSLFDTLRIQPADGLLLTCTGAGAGLDVPDGDANLVLRAARALQEACGARDGARLALEKRIPPGRGFGGGSSDAAAALVGLNALWDTGLAPDELSRIGASIGSDVPLFLGPPLAVMRGRGEEIEPVRGRSSWRLVLAWPDFASPTADVYAAYDCLGQTEDDRPAATEVLARLDGPAHQAKPFLVNDLEPAADTIRGPRLGLRAVLEAAGAEAVGMTGSGSAYFAAADTEPDARRWADAVRAAGAETCLARLLVDGIEQQERPT